MQPAKVARNGNGEEEALPQLLNAPFPIKSAKSKFMFRNIKVPWVLVSSEVISPTVSYRQPPIYPETLQPLWEKERHATMCCLLNETARPGRQKEAMGARELWSFFRLV